MAPLLVTVATASAIASAVGAARPGETIAIAAGEYAVNLTIARSGTARAPIVLRAAPGARVVLSARDPLRRVIELENASHWRLEDLHVRGARHADIRITGGTDNVIRRCEIYDARKKGIIANGDRITIEHSWIHDISQPVDGADTQGIVTWGASHLVIADNVITTPGDGILVGGAEGLSRTSTDVRILRNHFHAEDAWYGRLHTENAIDIKNVDGLLVEGNFIHHYRGREDDDAMGCAVNVVTRDKEVGGVIDHVRFERNVIGDVARALAVEGADGPGRHFSFRHNFVFAATFAHAVPRKPPGGLYVGNWDGVDISDNTFLDVEHAAVYCYGRVTGFRFEGNALIRAAPAEFH
jgi:parallel beta helix pectate lyase-like protein